MPETTTCSPGLTPDSSTVCPPTEPPIFTSRIAYPPPVATKTIVLSPIMAVAPEGTLTAPAGARAGQRHAGRAPRDDARPGGNLGLEHGGTGGGVYRRANGGDAPGDVGFDHYGHAGPDRADEPLGQLADNLIAVGGVDHIRRGGSVHGIARLDVGGRDAPGDRRGQRIGAAPPLAIDHFEDARLFGDIGACFGRQCMGFISARAGDDAFAGKLREPGRVRPRDPCPRIGARQVGPHRQHVAAGNNRERLALPDGIAFNHQRPHDHAGKGRGHGHARIGGRLDHRRNDGDGGFARGEGGRQADTKLRGLPAVNGQNARRRFPGFGG